MMHLITGGSASGKSVYAEDLAVRAGRERFYIATMRPFGEEGMERVRKHRSMREGKGFVTVECCRDLCQVQTGSGAYKERVILLECMSNLVANELFEAGGKDEEICQRIWEGIRHLQKQAENLMIVTNEIFSDGLGYDSETLRYIRLLAMVNQRLVQAADQVTEVVYGIPVPVKAASTALRKFQ